MHKQIKTFFRLILLLLLVLSTSCRQGEEQPGSTKAADSSAVAADSNAVVADSSAAPIDSAAAGEPDSTGTAAPTPPPAQTQAAPDSTKTTPTEAAPDSSVKAAQTQAAPDSVKTGGAEKMIESIKEHTPDIPFSVGQFFWAVIFFISALLIIKYLTQFLEALAERWTNLRLTVKRLIPVIRIITWTMTFYVILVNILTLQMQTLIAFTASAGIAIGFAAQDILKNIFGGLMLLLDRPFQVGDKIEAGGHYGEVVQIGLRTVRIVTPDDNLVSIPNGEVMNQAVSNANAGEPNCQVVAEFYLPPEIDIPRLKKIAYRAAAVSRYVYLNKPIAVIIKNEVHEARSMLKMRLKAYVLDIRYEFPFASEMTETVIQELLQQRLVTPDQMAAVVEAKKK